MSDLIGKDTGRDCAHCGGTILLQQEVRDGVPWSFYECAECGCRWTMTDDLFQTGNLPACRRQTAPAERPPSPLANVPPTVWVVVAVIVVALLFPPVTALLIRFGIYLFSILRFVALPIVLALLAWGGYIYGKRRAWW